jgi:hypothetical protein
MTLFVYNMLPALPCAINQLQVVSKENTGKTVTTIIAYSNVRVCFTFEIYKFQVIAQK